VRTVSRAEAPALLLADQLRPHAAGVPALTLALHAGDRVGLWWQGKAPGRSAYLRTLARLQKPASGRLIWQGVDVTRRPRRLLPVRLRRAILLLWSDPYALFDDSARIGTLSGDAKAREVKSPTDRLDCHRLSPALGEFRVRSLSGAERVRLGLTYWLRNAQSLPGMPRVILVDDLFSQLVPETWPELLQCLDRAAGDAGALLVASRYPEVVQAMQRVYTLRDGEFTEQGRCDN
jgi:ABC-type branched-subunit amino acid transport system ATPase component